MSVVSVDHTHTRVCVRACVCVRVCVCVLGHGGGSHVADVCGRLLAWHVWRQGV